MSALLQSIKNLFSASPADQRHDDPYLAEAVDIYDLERRMRELDAGRANLFAR